MASRKVKFVAGEYYHIYNRGAHRASIIREKANYFFILEKVKTYIRKYDLTIIAYVLMPNHYHFLVRQNGEYRAGLLPQRVFNSYTKAYNKRYDHSGTLFEGAYEAIHVNTYNYLLHLCRYIHANPVKDGLVGGLEDWAFSNYAEFIGTREGTLVDREFIKDNFYSPQEYTDFVKDYLLKRDLPDDIKGYLTGWGAE